MGFENKRALRRLKREVKRTGGKRRRRQLKRDLVEHPEEAPYSRGDFGHSSSGTLNGLDKDSTRRQKDS